MTKLLHEIIYFQGKGRAELVRIFLHLAKLDWKDTRFGFSEWKDVQASSPLGCVPILKIGDVTHVQSCAMARYAGRLAGWYPEDNPMEALVVDEIVESLNELMDKIPRTKDKEELKKLRQEYESTVVPKYAKHCEATIQRNGGVGFTPKPSIADVAMALTVDWYSAGFLDHLDTKFFQSYPGIMATAKMVNGNELIQEYRASQKKE